MMKENGMTTPVDYADLTLDEEDDVTALADPKSRRNMGQAENVEQSD